MMMNMVMHSSSNDLPIKDGFLQSHMNEIFLTASSCSHEVRAGEEEQRPQRREDGRRRPWIRSSHFLVGHQGVFVELSRETGGDFSISTSLFVVDVFSAATALLLLPIIPEGIHSFGWPSGNQMWQHKSAIIHSSCFFPTDVRCAHGFPGFSHRGAGFAIAMMTTGTLSLT